MMGKLIEDNLDIVFFIYGLAFVAMGIAILTQPKKESAFSLAKPLWLLAAFGITHGINEWLDMWAIIKGRNELLDLSRWVILVISYIFIFEFGRRIFKLELNKSLQWRKRIASYLVWWLTPLIVLLILTMGFVSYDFWKTGSIWTRYLLCFPGTLLIFFGLISYYRSEKALFRQLNVQRYFQLAAISLLAYGILGGLIVPKGDFFPSNLLNTDSFFSSTHIPVQFFRAVIAIITAIGIVKILTIFNWETQRCLEVARLEKELEKKYRLDSLGVLAGGIAHDFNNLMMVILGNISLCKMLLDPPDKNFKRLTDAEKACERAKELAGRLITFSIGGEPLRKTVLISDMLRETVSSTIRDSNILSELEIAENLYPVKIDEIQMNQVFTNIITNSMEAMPEGGALKVKAGNITLNEDNHLRLKSGDYILISKNDTGKGIPHKDLTRIFDPYFTTKQMGSEKGTGLGLSICYSIIKKHGGLITAESKAGIGTTFHIYLPVAPDNTIKQV